MSRIRTVLLRLVLPTGIAVATMATAAAPALATAPSVRPAAASSVAGSDQVLAKTWIAGYFTTLAECTSKGASGVSNGVWVLYTCYFTIIGIKGYFVLQVQN